MSEKSTSTTTSFMNSTVDGMDKPPLSSDSSIDSGCNLSTSDSIKSNHQHNTVTNQPSANAMTNHSCQNGNRANPLMLQTQPNVPPPPPPPPLPQLQESIYCLDDVYDNRASIYQHLSNTSVKDINSNSSNSCASFATSRITNGSANTSRCSTTISLTGKSTQNLQLPSAGSQLIQQGVINKRSSTSSLESTSSIPLMPMNVKGMLLHGLPSEEVMRNWLSSIKCEEQIENFIYHGYDIHLVTKMTPQDLAAIGCKSPMLRKKLLSEIKKLNLDYDIPDFDKTTTLGKWLESLKLSQYYDTLIAEGYTSIEKACQLTWEDLEEIGVTKLGHQKRLLMAIDKKRKLAQQEDDSQNESAIYDVHPNHRISLNGMGTIGRVRSGLFQTRSGANLDHRGLPVAKVMPAFKHVVSPILEPSSNQSAFMNVCGSHSPNSCLVNGADGVSNSDNNSMLADQQHKIYDIANNIGESLNLSDLSTTMKRHRAPLPPVRSNSLKFPQTGINADSQSVYGCRYSATNGNTNSTSFLRTPKLGTLTATTNKMLTSGGHIQALSGDQQPTNRPLYYPVREAPLPPTHPHNQTTQPCIPEKIEEETATMINNDYLGRSNCSVPSGDNFSNEPLMNLPQLASSDEFPPAPPSQDQLSTS